MTISAEELKALEEEHFQGHSLIRCGAFLECNEKWPCSTSRLIKDYRTLQETLADELSENLMIAARIGIYDAIKTGKSYHDAEIELFETLHNALAGARQRMEELERRVSGWRNAAIIHRNFRAEHNRLLPARAEMLQIFQSELRLARDERDTLQKRCEAALGAKEGMEYMLEDEAHQRELAHTEAKLAKEERDTLQKRCKELEQSNVRLREVLRHAEEWMAEDGCDCGVDEPGTCGLCEVRALLELAP